MSEIYFPKKQILIMCPNPKTLVELKLELRDNFDVYIASQTEAAIRFIHAYEIAVIIIHIDEEREASFHMFGEVEELAKVNNIPIIFLAEKGNDNDEINAFLRGAVDYTVRRRGTIDALNSRINLRIRASQVKQEDTYPIRNILVVDDVQLNLDMVNLMLSEVEGLQLDFSTSGEDAVEKYKNDPTRYSLILMDIQMKGISGIDAALSIRALPFENATTIPIVAMTADSKEKEVSNYYNSGMNDCIAKPMEYAKLMDVISEYCF